MGTCGRPSAPMVTAVRPGERGAVSAEAAVVIPLLVALTIGLVWLVALAVTQVRVVDAARETARAAARGEDDAVAIAQGRRIAPQGATVRIDHADGQVVAEVAVGVEGPGGLFAFLPSVPVTSTAVAAEEPQ